MKAKEGRIYGTYYVLKTENIALNDKQVFEGLETEKVMMERAMDLDEEKPWSGSLYDGIGW